MTKAFKTGIDAPAVSVAGTAVSVDGHTHAGGGAPADATYVVASANATLTNERVLTGGGTSYITITDNGSSTVTIAVDATSANTASKVVARDASGNFSANTITAALTGNASTATTLQTSRNINGIAFNGSADINVAAAAGTLTGTTLNSTVTDSSLVTFGSGATLTTPNITQGTATPSFSSNSYTIVAGDAGKLLLASNSTTAGDVKIPTDATTNYAIGTQIHILQTGSGQLTISATTSGTTTVYSSGATTAGPKLRRQYSAATLVKTAANTWYVFGDIT